jgi:hypothetical protein
MQNLDRLEQLTIFCRLLLHRDESIAVTEILSHRLTSSLLVVLLGANGLETRFFKFCLL